jgi:hypothetical protein
LNPELSPVFEGQSELVPLKLDELVVVFGSILRLVVALHIPPRQIRGVHTVAIIVHSNVVLERELKIASTPLTVSYGLPPFFEQQIQAKLHELTSFQQDIRYQILC